MQNLYLKEIILKKLDYFHWGIDSSYVPDYKSKKIPSTYDIDLFENRPKASKLLPDNIKLDDSDIRHDFIRSKQDKIHDEILENYLTIFG